MSDSPRSSTASAGVEEHLLAIDQGYLEEVSSCLGEQHTIKDLCRIICLTPQNVGILGRIRGRY